MIALRALRVDPRFADLFAHVHVICWPILWWQLNLLRQWSLAHNIPEVLYSVTPWGFIEVRQFGAAPAPYVYKPIQRTFRPLTDASWGSDVPTNFDGLSVLEAMHTALILPRFSGGVGSRQRRESEGALPSPPNTS